MPFHDRAVAGSAAESDMTLFTIEEILEITGARLVAGDPCTVRGAVKRVITDSRNVTPGDLFVAFKGERFDGHQFLGQALHKGAVAVLINADVRIPSAVTAAAVSILAVPDTLVAYQRLAAYHRSRFDIPVVAVTGSNGKTTTKEMVARVLEERWTVLVTEGNLNNRIGVPQTLLRLAASHQAAIIEMGVDQKGQTSRLAELVRPTIGLITNIGPDHLEFFGTMDASAEAKGELLDWLESDDAVVLNADDPYFRYLAARARCRVVSFGLGPDAHVRALDVVHVPDGITCDLMLPDGARPIALRLPAHGLHNLANALAAAAVGYLCALESAQIARGLARFTPAAMRSQVERLGALTVLVDCYNANPASTKAALDWLAAQPNGARTIAVLGDMLELGPGAPAFHEEVGAYAAGHRIAELVTCGALARGFAKGAEQVGMASSRITEAPDAVRAAEIVAEKARPGDVVLVKGSRGMRMEQIVEALRAKFSSKRIPGANPAART